MNFKHLADQLGLDEEDFLELVELFIDTTKSDLAKIRQGVADNNPADAAAAAHSIKGAAGNLGFESMAVLSQKMEMQAKAGSLEGFAEYIDDLQAQLDYLAAH